MGQARQQQHHLLGFPLALPAGDQPSGLFILAERRLDHGTAVVGIGQGGRLQGGHGGHQHRLLVPAFGLGGPHDPLPGCATAAMRLEHRRALAPGARGGLPGPEGLAQFPHPPAVADFCDDVIPATEQPVADVGGPKASIQAEHHPLAALPRPAQAGFPCAARRFQCRDCRGFASQQGLMEDFTVITGRAP